VDAVAKLLHMGVKSKTKDVVHVLMHCCQREKSYNRYYGQIATNLCTQLNEFKFSLQVGFYQKLKNLTDNELNDRGVVNLSQLLAHVVGESALPLLILKAMPLTSMTPLQSKFLGMFFIALFTQHSEKQIFDAFKRLVVVVDEEADRVGKELEVFFDHFFDKPAAIAAYKEATKGKSLPMPVDMAVVMKKLKLAKQVL